MGSVSDEVTCPDCGNKHAHYEIYYKTGEEYVFCNKCGYSYERIITNRDETKDNWKPEYRESTKHSHGCWNIEFGGFGQTGSFLNEEGIKEFEREFEETGFRNKEGMKATEVTYTFKKDGKIWMKDLINKTCCELEEKEMMEQL